MINLQFLICTILIIILIIWLINKKQYLETFGTNCNFTLDKTVSPFKDEPILSNCIKQCSNINQSIDDEAKCDITQCQERCLDCGAGGDGASGGAADGDGAAGGAADGDGGRWDDKASTCPWTNELIRPPPDAPKIRGFLENVEDDDVYAKISIEWKRPNDNGSKIINYVAEIKESLSNRDSVKILYINSDCDICSYTITDLKKKTSYDISLRTIGNISTSEIEDIELSASSNVLTLTTNGELGNSLQNIYNDMASNFKQNYNNNVGLSCNKYGTNHILDTLNTNEIDIKYYLEKNQNNKHY